MHSALHKLYRRFSNAVQTHIKCWLKPSNLSLASGSAIDLTRSRTALIAENAFLRQQLIILHQHSKRPKLTNFLRIKLLLLARATPNWKQALLIVQPDTLLRWHRELFCIIWRRQSKPKPAEPRISTEAIALIRQMASDNRT
ncbi:MAG: hypothetical protein GY759_13890 [Chloroflexi bacterium]|nr:hypothetical protein [Chloroflexota bacterium]